MSRRLGVAERGLAAAAAVAAAVVEEFCVRVDVLIVGSIGAFCPRLLLLLPNLPKG